MRQEENKQRVKRTHKCIPKQWNYVRKH